LLARN